MAERRPPSRARRARALRAGDTPLSPFAVRAASLGVTILLAPSLLRALSAHFTEALHTAITKPESAAATSVPVDVAKLVAPLLLAAAVAALATGMTQTEATLAWRPPRLGRLFDPLRAYDVARALLIAAAVTFIGWRAFTGELPSLAAAIGKSGATLDASARLASSIAWPALALLILLATVDVVIRRAAWLERISPSPEEARRERRETEVSPEVRQARDRLRRTGGEG
jgi:flagellar biosynthesis protein FlhB